MTKRLGLLTLAVLCASFVLVSVPLASEVRADDSDSITDLSPLATATPTPDPYLVTADPTPEPTPEALPTTGTSPYLLIALAAVLFISVGAYAVLPRHQD